MYVSYNCSISSGILITHINEPTLHITRQKAFTNFISFDVQNRKQLKYLFRTFSKYFLARAPFRIIHPWYNIFFLMSLLLPSFSLFYTLIHRHTHTHTKVHTHTRIHAHTHRQAQIQTHTHTHTDALTYTHTHIHTRAHTHTQSCTHSFRSYFPPPQSSFFLFYPSFDVGIYINDGEWKKIPRFGIWK